MVPATDTVFDGNMATQGSTAIIAQADQASTTVHVTLERCTFRNHDAGTYDAGVMALNEFVVLNSYNCTFEDNSAGNGGVIYAALASASGTLRINLVDTVFRNNVASELGGAISVSVGEGPSVVLLSQGSFFYNNSAVGGGAISATGPAVVELLETHFTGNQADDDGGAVAVQSGTSLYVVCVVRSRGETVNQRYNRHSHACVSGQAHGWLLGERQLRDHRRWYQCACLLLRDNQRLHL